MNRQVRVQSDSPRSRNQFLLAEKEKPTEATKKLSKTTTMKKKEGQGQGQIENGSKTNRFGEIVGGTAAECAAVCCCCPCALMNLLVLAIYKMPACICRKAKKRHRLMKKKKQGFLVGPQNNSIMRREDLEKEVKAVVEKHKNHSGSSNHNHSDGESAAVDLEKRMWDQFYATGFWRSPSQRH